MVFLIGKNPTVTKALTVALDDIGEFIAQDNPDAADRVIIEIFDSLRALVLLPGSAHEAGVLFLSGGPFNLYLLIKT